MSGGAALGKGAWDCDKREAIPPEKEAEVFEEIATMDFPFEGIPTIPPGKDMKRMAFYCGNARYLVTASPANTVAEVKQRLFAGGIAASDPPVEYRHTPGIQEWRDLELIYAGQLMEASVTAARQSVTRLLDIDQKEPHIVRLMVTVPRRSISTCTQNDMRLAEYHVPPGCKALIAIEGALLRSGKMPRNHPFWN